MAAKGSPHPGTVDPTRGIKKEQGKEVKRETEQPPCGCHCLRGVRCGTDPHPLYGVREGTDQGKCLPANVVAPAPQTPLSASLVIG